MSEVSKEAMEKAERIVSHLASERKWGVHEARDHIATALQELMDERDAWLRRHAEGAAQHITVVERAEKAEADYLQVAQALGYAECPEGQDGWHTAEPEVLAQRFRELETRSVIAEERLAELVRQVREWDRDVHPFEWSPRLDAILAEFEVEP